MAGDKEKVRAAIIVMIMGFGTELLIRIAAIVAITDLLMFYLIMMGRIRLTWALVIGIIIITIIPIIVNIWFVLTKYKLSW